MRGKHPPGLTYLNARDTGRATAPPCTERTAMVAGSAGAGADARFMPTVVVGFQASGALRPDELIGVFDVRKQADVDLALELLGVFDREYHDDAGAVNYQFLTSAPNSITNAGIRTVFIDDICHRISNNMSP